MVLMDSLYWAVCPSPSCCEFWLPSSLEIAQVLITERYLLKEREEGKKRGRKEGKEEGREGGREEGRKERRKEGRKGRVTWD